MERRRNDETIEGIVGRYLRDQNAGQFQGDEDQDESLEPAADCTEDDRWHPDDEGFIAGSR